MSFPNFHIHMNFRFRRLQYLYQDKAAPDNPQLAKHRADCAVWPSLLPAFDHPCLFDKINFKNASALLPSNAQGSQAPWSQGRIETTHLVNPTYQASIQVLDLRFSHPLLLQLAPDGLTYLLKREEMAPRCARIAIAFSLLIGLSICGASAQPLEVEHAVREVIMQCLLIDG